MLKKIFWVSAVFMTFSCVAFADDGSEELRCAAGKYMPAGSSECDADCPNGFYCPGMAVTTSPTENRGLLPCPSDYSQSDTGASDIDQCYRNYTCPTLSPSDCDAHAASCSYVPGRDTGREYHDGTITATCEREFNSCELGYIYVPATSIPEMPAVSTAPNSVQYRALSTGGYTSNSDNDLTTGGFKLKYTTGTTTGQLKGIVTCSNKPASQSLDVNTTPQITGRYCWCKPTTWVTAGGNEVTLSGEYVYDYDGVSNSACGNVCARYCAEDLRSNKNSVRTNLFGTLTETPAHCELDPDVTLVSCPAGQYGIPDSEVGANNEHCADCPQNHYCPGVEFIIPTDQEHGKFQCPTGMVSPVGTKEIGSCGRVLHIGENALYLRSVRKTTPSLNVDVDLDGVADFFGNVVTTNVPMTNGTSRHLKLQYNNQVYYVYDDTVGL